MEKPPVKVMFVCLGNICRSPAAECILRAEERKDRLPVKLISASSGTGARYHNGSGADPRMITHTQRRGYSILTVAKQFQLKMVSEYDYILAMDRSVYMTIKKSLDKALHHKITMFTEYCRIHSAAGVPDPYYGNGRNFDYALDIIVDGCLGLLDHIRQTTTEKK